MNKVKHLIIFFFCLYASLLTYPSFAETTYLDFDKVNITFFEDSSRTDLADTLENEGRIPIYIKLSTERIFSCLLPLEVDYFQTGPNNEVLIFDIKHVKHAGLCITTVGPATFTQKLPINGFYREEFIIMLNHKDRQDQYSLILERDMIRIKAIKALFSNLQTAILERTPEDLILSDEL